MAVIVLEKGEGEGMEGRERLKADSEQREWARDCVLLPWNWPDSCYLVGRPIRSSVAEKSRGSGSELRRIKIHMIEKENNKYDECSVSIIQTTSIARPGRRVTTRRRVRLSTEGHVWEMCVQHSACLVETRQRYELCLATAGEQWRTYHGMTR